MVNQKDLKRYEVWKKVIQANRTKVLGVNDIASIYMQQINKASLSVEIDEVLDAIIENELILKKAGKSVL